MVLVKDKLAIFLLTLLIFGAFEFPTSTVQAQFTQPQIPPIEGDMTFKVYPDGSIKVKVVGSLEQALQPYENPPPVYNGVIDLDINPAGMNLTDVNGNFVIKLSPAAAVTLSGLDLEALDLDIEVHSEDLRTNATILFNMPSFMGVNATIGSVTDWATLESILDFDLAVTMWYTAFPKESIQLFVQNFLGFKSQLASQISEVTEGNLTIQDLTLVSSEISPISATLTFTGSIVGDFSKGMMALLTKTVPSAQGVSPIVPTISPEILRYTKIKSTDLYVTFDKEELAFKGDFEGVMEGDVDRQINDMKNIFLEQFLLSPQITPEMALVINNVLLPTDMSIVNLNIAFEYMFDGEKHDLNFAFDGLGLKPPTTEALLTILQEALTGSPMPGFTLTLEGASDEKEFVEFQVPPTTTEPQLKEPRKVVWKLANLTNLNLVSFKVREWPTLTSTVSQTKAVAGDTVNIEGVLTIEGEPLAKKKVDIAVNDMVVRTVETDPEGGFSFTYKFEDIGSYEVKATFKYYEKTLESPISTVTVRPASLLTPEVTALIIAVVVTVAAVGLILAKRRKRL